MKLLVTFLAFVSVANCAPKDCITRDEFKHEIQELSQKIVMQQQQIQLQQEEIEDLKYVQENEQMNITVEERVTLLEFEMSRVFEDITILTSDVTEVNSDITNINDDITRLEDDVNDLDEDIESQITILNAEQILQDDRLLAIEQNDQGVQESIIALQAANTELTSDLSNVDGRVSAVNSTAADSAVRVENLENRVTILEFNVSESSRNIIIGKDRDISKDAEFLNDTTVEERVTILEFQVATIQNDITEINGDISTVTGDVTALTNDVNTLEDEVRDLDEDLEDQLLVIAGEQVQQDERLFTIEQNEEALFGTVTAIQESDSAQNSAISSIGGRVGLLENTTATQNGRLSMLEVSGTVAFQVDLNEYTTIPIDSVVLFDTVDLNLGNGYNSTTGEFIVPTGGAGLYFFYVNFFGDNNEVAEFLIRVNGGNICNARADQNDANSGADTGTASCGTIWNMNEGDLVDVFYTAGTDDTPVISNGMPYNTFTGFRIAPEYLNP